MLKVTYPSIMHAIISHRRTHALLLGSINELGKKSVSTDYIRTLVEFLTIHSTVGEQGLGAIAFRKQYTFK